MKRNQTLKVTVAALVCSALVLSLGGFEVVGAQQTADHEAVANNLAVLLRAARAVISDNQKLINDETKGDKGLTGEKVVVLAKQNYKSVTNKEFSSLNPGTLEGKLMKAMLDSIKEVMDNAQPLINKQGMGFKGFLPAVFAKQVADGFRKNADGLADIKLTAPKSYVRNRANTPDAWEDQVIETKFKANGWPKGMAYVEMGEKKGKRALRLMIPEYYGPSCLACHGDPKGAIDITGGKKEGGKVDDLGGAISVAIYAK